MKKINKQRPHSFWHPFWPLGQAVTKAQQSEIIQASVEKSKDLIKPTDIAFKTQ